MIYAMEQQQQQAAPMALSNKQEQQQHKLRSGVKLLFRAIYDIIRVENKKRPQKSPKKIAF